MLRNLSFLLILISIKATGQVTIKNKIVDSESGEGLPFAHVYIQGTSIGSYSNEEGNVFLKINSESKYDSIVVSCMGYQTLTIHLNDIKQIILMKKSLFALDELVVYAKKKKFDAKAFVKKAVSNIPDNHALNHAVRGIYRQIHYSNPLEIKKLEGDIYGMPVANKKLTKYLNLKEAFINYEVSSNQLNIFQLRRSNDFRKFLFIKKGSKPFSEAERINTESSEEAIDKELSVYTIPGFITNDPILSHKEEVYDKNARYRAISSFSFANLNQSFVKRHSFKLDYITFLDDKEVYVIKILPNSKSYTYENKYFKKHSFIPVGRLFLLCHL